MQKPEVPKNEKLRQEALDSYNLVDTLSEQSFDDLTLIASQICDTPIALVSLIDSDRQWFKSKFGLSATETHRDISFCGHAINEPNKIFEISDAKNDIRFKDNPLVTGDLNIGFYAGVPLVDSSKFALGTLCVIDEKERVLTENQKKALEALAREVTSRIELRKRVQDTDEDLKVSQIELEKLHENNYRYQSLIEFAPMGVAITDLDGKMVQTNKAFEELMGYNKVELSQISVSNLIHPEDKEETISELQKLKSGEIENFTVEKRYFSKDDKIIWAKVSSCFVPNFEGKPTYLIGILEDITEKRKLNKDYNLNVDRLNLAIKATNDGILDWTNIESDELYWSPRFYEMLGYKAGELKNSMEVFLNEIIHPEDLKVTENQISNCLTNDSAFDLEFRLKSKEGGYKWCRGRGNGIKDENGIITRMTGSISDIDDRKEVELKLEKTQSFLKKVTDIAPSIIYVFNHKTMSNEFVNREIGVVLGYSNQEIQDFGDQLMPTLCHPDDLNNVFGHFTTVSQLKGIEIASIEYRMKHKDGHYRWLLSEDTVFERDEDNSVQSQLGVATDITKLKETQQKFVLQTKELKSQNEDITQLAYVATHDLKSPMITIKGHFDYLKQQFKNPTEEICESIEFIEEEIEKHTVTLKGLTDAIRIKEVVLEDESINLGEIVDQSIANFSNEIDLIGGRIKQDLNSNTEIKGNLVYLQSIINNLISNSIKYRSPSRQLIITISIQRDNNKVLLSIEDNGLGIDLDLQGEKIFKMFNQFHNKSDGNGMGLYMVKNMVEKLGGTIEIESDVAKGTKFNIELIKY